MCLYIAYCVPVRMPRYAEICAGAKRRFLALCCEVLSTRTVLGVHFADIVAAVILMLFFFFFFWFSCVEL